MYLRINLISDKITDKLITVKIGFAVNKRNPRTVLRPPVTIEEWFDQAYGTILASLHLSMNSALLVKP